MARMFDICDHCGHVSPGPTINGSGGRMSFKGEIAKCPNCKEWTPLLDGVFTVENDEIKLIDGPAITKIKLEKIRQILEQRGELSTQELDEKIEKATGEKNFLARLSQYLSIGNAGLGLGEKLFRLVTYIYQNMP